LIDANFSRENQRCPLPKGTRATLATLVSIAAASCLMYAQLSADASLVAGREAVLSRNYSKAVSILRTATEQYPQDARLKLELGRAYLYRGNFHQAEEIFRSLLAADAGNRDAKLELAHALRHQGKLRQADELYRELLASDPRDEPAAIGLANNLIRENQLTEAAKVLDAALAVHPNSLRLQEYSDRLQKGEMNLREVDEELAFDEYREGPEHVETAEATGEYVSDSSGNRVWASRQALGARITPRLRTYLRTEERLFHGPAEPDQLVFTVGDELRAQLNEKLKLVGGGGAVRFDDGSLAGIYRAGLEVQPARRLLLAASYQRNPVYPDGEAAEFRIMARGVETSLQWQPGEWNVNAGWARQDYSDNNSSNRGSAEVVRNFRMQKFSWQAGYRFLGSAFQKDTEHGYFSPELYRGHFAVLGTQWRASKHFRADWIGRVGAESLRADRPYHTAWEVSALGELRLGNWEIVPRYAYYHLVQSSGAFRANVGTLTVRYHF